MSDRETELLASLDPAQAEAAGAPDGPLLVVAGPGSGKTRVLTHRVAVLLERDWDPWRVLVVTFTNKAAGELRERLGGLVGDANLDQLWVSTFHAACVRILRTEHEAAGLPRNFAIADTADTERILRRIVKGLDMADNDGDVRKLARSARSAISWSRNRRVSISEAGDDYGVENLDVIDSQYRAKLAESNAVDFDGLLLRCHTLFARGDEISEKWAGRFGHVLIDEYQDTNPIQLDLVRHLTRTHRNLTAVGDLDQAVYGFRGADPEGMAGFTNDWPDARVVILDRNYRSSAPIVDTAAAVIAANPAQHRAHQRAAGAHADLAEPVVLRACRTDRDEAAWVQSMVRQVGGPRAEHAILVRTNAQTRPLEEAFASAAMPYRVVGATRFYDRAEVRDAMAWLRAAVNPRDALAVERAAASPRRGLGEKAFVSLMAHAGPGGDLAAAATDLAAIGGRGAAAYASLVRDLATVRHAALEGPDNALTAIMAIGLRQHWSQGQEAESRLENLDELIRFAGEFRSDGRNAEGAAVSELSPAQQTLAFLEHAALVAASDDEAQDAVSILTVHAAKGREFDYVYVVGLEEELFPHARSLSLPAEIREERRLLFVAVSRARKRLFLSYARERFRYGKRDDTVPSRFLTELPDTVVRTGEQPKAKSSLSPRLGTFAKPRPGSSPSTSSRSVKGRPAPARQPSPSGPKAFTGSRNAPSPAPSPGPRLDPAAVQVGAAVLHSAFGPGVVEAIDGRTISVGFADGTKRKLDATMAPMRLA